MIRRTNYRYHELVDV